MISFEELKDQERRQREADLEQLESFAIAAADGKEVDSGQLLATLRVCGKSVDEFQETVSTITRRRQLKATVDQIPAIRQRLGAVMGDIEREQQAFKLQVETYSAKDAALNAQRVNIQSELNTAEESRRELRNTAPQWLLDQRQQLGKARGELIQQREKLAERIANSESTVASNSHRLAEAKASGRAAWEIAENEKIAAGEEQALKHLRGQSVELAAQIRDLEVEINECEAKFTDTL